MSRRRANIPNHLRVELAHALGYNDYPNELSAEPHLRYIENRHIGRCTIEEYLALFLLVIKHFSVRHEKPTESPTESHSIRELLDAFTGADGDTMFADTKAGSVSRKEDVEDTVMYIVGTWSLLLSSFVQLPNGFRKVTLAYNLQTEVHKEAYDEDLAGLLRGSYLLPHPNMEPSPAKVGLEDDVVRTAAKLVSLLSRSSAAEGSSLLGAPSNRSLSTQSTLGRTKSWGSPFQMDAMDSLESMAIKASRLNAFTLNIFAAVEISWTYNLSRHMMLSRIGGRYVIELFALPCALNADSLTSSAVGIPSELAQEIQESYCILFSAWTQPRKHAIIWRWLGIRKFCWCWSCSADRHKSRAIDRYRELCGAKPRRMARHRKEDHQSEHDPLLVALMNGTETSDWTPDLFPCLWSRVVDLEEHLQAAKPWSIWILFRDRRDTLQFWTFCFATIVVLLTFIQVVLGVAQVIGSFN